MQNRQRCTKHNALVHDFFISYRVSADKITAEKLASHIDGRRKPEGKNFVTYLDKNCLIQGMDWEEGFTYGIRNSKVLLLLISQGTINTMIGKAKRGDVDNVLKEHLEAIRLKENLKRIIIPVCIASLGQNKVNREGYIKLNRDAVLRQFDFELEAASDEQVRMRLQTTKEILAKIFALPTVVNMEPDSIGDQVPKILQIWYSTKQLKKNRKLGARISDSTKAVLKPSCYSRACLYPSQSFRVSIIGAIIGFFGMFITLSLVFMHSKSKRHTDLKIGVAAGNIIAFVCILIACIAVASDRFYLSSHVYCDSCESIAEDKQDESLKYISAIPAIKHIFDGCGSVCTVEGWSEMNCIECACAKVYNTCASGYALSIALLLVIILQVILIVATFVITRHFISTESFSMSLQ